MQKYIEIEIGPAPTEETCAQVGEQDYSKRSRIECEAFKRQILRHYPVPESVDAGVRICVSPHDFGSYREVSVCYCDKAGSDWASAVEKDDKRALVTWDKQAIEELGLRLA